MLDVVFRSLVGLVAFFAALLCVASLLYPQVRSRRTNSGDVVSAAVCALIAFLCFFVLGGLA